MTKRKDPNNPNPHRFGPGNKAAVKEKTLVKTHFSIDPDQLTWLRNQPDGISANVRKAIDLYRNLSVAEFIEAPSRDG
jgi:hypothetical protein